jgi:hypothetical protein
VTAPPSSCALEVEGEMEIEESEEAQKPPKESQVFEGKVTRFAPPTPGGGEEGLYETLWSDGATVYFGETAYRNARMLYEKVQAEQVRIGERAVEDVSRKRKHDEVEGQDQGMIAGDIQPDVNVTIHPNITANIQPDITANIQPDIKVDIQPDITVDIHPDFKPDITVDIQPDFKVDIQPDITVDIQPDFKVDIQPDITVDIQANTSMDTAENENENDDDDDDDSDGGIEEVDEDEEGEGEGEGMDINVAHIDAAAALEGDSDGDGDGAGDLKRPRIDDQTAPTSMMWTGAVEEAGLEARSAALSSAPHVPMLIRSKYSVPYETVLKWRYVRSC